MAVTPKRLAQVALGTIDTVIGTCPASLRWIVTSVMYCNTTGSPITARLHHVRPSEYVGPAALNAIAYGFPIPANSTQSILNGTDRMVLTAADELRGLASATGITVTVYGAEVDV